jgi:hypothetical protein
MVQPVRLPKPEVARHPELPWNEYIHILALFNYTDLTATQQVAHLVFWYEQEVQNGGHLQYFENQRTLGQLRIEETVQALNAVGAGEHAQVLADAAGQLRSRTREPIRTAQEFVGQGLAREFDEYDRRFHACPTCLVDYLKQYLDANFGDFVEIVEADPPSKGFRWKRFIVIFIVVFVMVNLGSTGNPEARSYYRGFAELLGVFMAMLLLALVGYGIDSWILQQREKEKEQEPSGGAGSDNKTD